MTIPTWNVTLKALICLLPPLDQMTHCTRLPLITLYLLMISLITLFKA